jgi:hypothetical protein
MNTPTTPGVAIPTCGSPGQAPRERRAWRTLRRSAALLLVTAYSLTGTVWGEALGVQEVAAKPADEALAASLAKLRETYQEQYARSGSQRQRELAQQFLELAGRDDVDWTASDRYVLLDQARVLSQGAGDLELAFSAIDALAVAFAVEAQQLRCETVAAVVPNVRSSEAGGASTRAMALVADLLDSGDWKRAAVVLDSAEILARKSRDGELKRRVENLRSAIDDAKRLVELEERIKLHPDDPETNRLLGLYYCFVLFDYEQGLPCLVRADDAGLREAASLDLGGPRLPADCRKAADSWYAWGKGRLDRAGQGALARARHWYARAVPGLTRFDAVAVEATLRELDAILARSVSDTREDAEVVVTPRSAPAVLRQLEQARKHHQDEMEQIRRLVAAELAASQVEAEKKGGDQAVEWPLNRVLLAKEAFEENGEFPLPPLITTSLQSRIDKAQEKHRATLERVLRAVSRSGPAEQIAELEQELAELESDPAGLHARMSGIPAPEISVQAIGERIRGYGAWVLKDGVLTCPEGGMIVFGDPEWTDYDLVVTVRIDEVDPQEFSILARVNGTEAWELNAFGWGMSNRDLRPQVDGEPVWHKHSARVWMKEIQPTEPGDTFTMGLRLRGESVAVLIDGEEVRESSHPRLLMGRVGLSTRGPTTVYLDVEVRDSEGRLLWKGLPDVPK